MIGIHRAAHRALLAAVLAAGIVGPAPLTAHAQAAGAATPPGIAWPTRPVRIVVPVPPGGSLDLLARTVARDLSPRIGQPVLVENHAGAGGNTGFALVANAAPDGHTLLHGWDSLAINPALYPSVPYRLAQFAPVTLAITSPQVLVVNPARVAAASLGEFLASARSRPGRYSVASAGNGSPGHLAITLLESSATVDLLHIPYRGGGPAMADLVAGHLDASIVTLPAALPHVRAGKLRALGVSTAARAPGVKEIPTIAEGGVKGYELTSWQGFFVPSGTPGEIIERLNREIVDVLRNRDVREQLVAQGFEVVGSTPGELARTLEASVPRWARLVRESGARLD